MPFWIIRGRITQEYADAIVSSTNTRQQGGDNVTAAVFREGGRELKQAYDRLGGVAPGKAKASDGYSLRCRHVIHTSAPEWKNGANGETEQLVSCYEESLRLCGELGCTSVAFPLISACSDPGQDETLIRIAMETIRRYLEDHDLTVCLVCPDTVMYSPDSKRYLDIREYIIDFGPDGIPWENEDEPELMEFRASEVSGNNENFWSSIVDFDTPEFGGSGDAKGQVSRPPDAEALPNDAFGAPTAGGDDIRWDIHNPPDAETLANSALGAPSFGGGGGLWDDDMLELAASHSDGIMPDAGSGPAATPGDSCPGSGVFSQAADCGDGGLWDDGLWDDDMPELAAPHSGGIMPDAGLFSYLRRYQDESFRDMLLRKIDEKHMTDAECYRKANIDRKLFNKIKNQPGYHPGKPTVLALAVALELPLEETQELLHKAGFYLSHSDRFDLIVEYFIREGDYDIYRINEALFFFDLRLLGSLA